MTDERHDHEETANDRWIGAMMHVQRFDTPERVDMLVDRSVRSLRAESVAARRRTRAWDWRTPVAAAASIAIVVGATLVFSPQPASADSLLRAAQVAESRPGERRFALTLVFPARPGESEATAPRATGTLDVRDDTHVRLELTFSDARTMVRGIDGRTSWVNSADGEILSVPSDAPWPRFIETPEGDFLADRMDAVLGDIGANYEIARCSTSGEERICASIMDRGFRGPENIVLTLEPGSHRVQRAEFTFGGPERGRGPDARGPEGRGPEGRGPEARGPEGRGPDEAGRGGRPGPGGVPPMRRGEGGPAMIDEAASAKPTGETGSGRPDARSAQRGGAGAGGRPRPERGPATLAGPSIGGGSGRESGRRAEPRTVTIERVDVPGGAFADNWFAPPSKPVRMAPPPQDGGDRGPGREGPGRDGPGRGDRSPPHPRSDGSLPPPRGDE